MIQSELDWLTVFGYLLTGFTHAFRFQAVPCGGQIVLYRVSGYGPSDPSTLGHCLSCRQTAIWDEDVRGLPFTWLVPT